MKHPFSAAVALALGLGLAVSVPAVSAHAQGTQPQPAMQGQQMTRHQAVKHASQQVKQVQERLKAEGFYKGQIDGVIGHGTRQALAKFQRHNGLRPTATLDQNTMRRLMGSEAVGFGSSAPHHRMTTPRHRNATSASGSGMQQPMNGETTNAPPPAGPNMPAAGGNNMPPQGGAPSH